MAVLFLKVAFHTQITVDEVVYKIGKKGFVRNMVVQQKVKTKLTQAIDVDVVPFLEDAVDGPEVA